ncbi:MAG: PEP/pyruvate-binding domain-containing protein [Polyangiales bacterium]
MSPVPLVRLEASTPEDRAVLGGKAAGLVRSLRAGLRVPEAHCIPVGVEPGPELDAALRAFHASFVAEHPGAALAVRSSGTAEDLEDASFAGIYRTILGVRTADALLEAVRSCRAAYDEAHAVAYRERRGAHTRGGIALVLQRLLEPEVAGVLLTENPQRPFASELVIEATYGLGEGLVSGRIDPDHVVRTREGRIVEDVRGEKRTKLVFDAALGVVEREVPAADRARRSLDEGQLDELAALARTVDARLGARADVEWAYENGTLYVLQHRPIVGLPPRSPRVVAARQLGDEYLSGYGMPLTRTFLVRWIRDVTFHDMARLMGREELLALEPMTEHEGYYYMNGAYASALLRAVPRAARSTGPVLWFPPSYRQRILEEPFEPKALLGYVRAPFRDRGALLHRNVAELEAHCRRIEATIVPRLSQDYGTLDDGEWQRQLDEVDAFGREHFRVIRWGMAYHGPLLHTLLERFLARFADDDGSLYATLLGGLSGTRTAEINRDLHALAGVARTLGLDSEVFAAELARFLLRHGHRGPSREITDPRWSETPEIVVGLVKAQLAHVDPARSPSRLEEAASERSRDAERRVLSRLRDPLRKAAFRLLLRSTREYTRYRENQRYHLDYVLAHCRKLVLEQARRLVARGALATADDVFLLEVDELRRLARGAAPWPGLADALEARRLHYLAHRHRMPATYLYDGIETEGELAEGERSASSSEGAGQGASRGKALGRARVATDLASLAAVEAGEILVVPSIDPTWTNVFPLLAGLVTETGGLLGHGALLAREYGIPAVSGVKQATQRFATGDLLELDGTSGTVRQVRT